MEYRETETAPEDKELSVVWGERLPKPEYGVALRLCNQWYKQNDPNPHARGRPCAVPDGWLPKYRSDWTKAEIRLCDILAMNPSLKRAS